MQQDHHIQMELNSRSVQASTSKSKSKGMAKIVEEEEEDEAAENLSSSCACGCFFCAMKQPDARLRRASVAAFFRELPHRYSEDSEDYVGAVAAVWRAAMDAPDDPELPSRGAIRCMSLLLARALADNDRQGQSAVPYYAAHAIGSYTIRSSAHAELAVSAGAVRPLLALLGGAMTWVEQRAAARALGHLASHDATYPAVARHAAEAVPLAVRAASTCVADVYASYVSLAPAQRPRYQRELLLTRGLGGSVEAEVRKAEEWASQLQCWSLYFLSSLASRDASSHAAICHDQGHPAFLRELCRMWGGLANGDSPAGVGLLRILCRSAVGRRAVAACPEALSSICDLARSSDDWQYMAIDCLLLLLLGDRDTWHAVADAAAPRLVDLAELRRLGPRRRLGDAITRALLRLDDDDHVDVVFRGEELGTEAKEALAYLTEMKISRKEREEAMSRDELRKRKLLAKEKKRQGNVTFWQGDADGAVELYTEALELCPLRARRERVVLHSNRAQCRLLGRERDPGAAASDSTRALSLARPANGHGRSLWRRAQAYDAMGMARESLLDCLAFAGAWVSHDRKGKKKKKKLPCCVARMIGKQMGVTGLFAGLAAKDVNKDGGGIVGREDDCMPRCSDDDGDDDDDSGDGEDSDDDDGFDRDGGSEVDEFVAETKLNFCRSGNKGLPIMAEETWRSRLARGKMKMHV